MLYLGQTISVIPAKAGIHWDIARWTTMDPGLRRDDDKGRAA
jgi:hypothetical protein